MIDRSATQLEIAAALPHQKLGGYPREDRKASRGWFNGYKDGQLEDGERISDYLKRNPEATVFNFNEFITTDVAEFKTPSQWLESVTRCGLDARLNFMSHLRHLDSHVVHE